jgi:hypothetical protein
MLVDQVTWVTDLLRPLWRTVVTECIGSKVMHLDATRLPVLDRDAPGGNRVGTLWATTVTTWRRTFARRPARRLA